MKDVLLIVYELFIKVFSNPSNETNNNNVPADKYIRLPKRVMKKIGRTQAFEKSFGFHVPHNQIDAYIKFWEKHALFRPFFKKLYDLQYLRYNNELKEVKFNRNWMTKLEFFSASIISIICLFVILFLIVIVGRQEDISIVESNITLELLCYLCIYIIAFAVFMVKLVIPHMNAIRFVERR